MGRFMSLFSVLLLVSAVFADEPTPATIRFPAGATHTTPAPKEPAKLTADLMYVIDSDVPILTIDSPAGIVKITEMAGPVIIRGRFVDGDGIEMRTYKGKQVFIVEAAANGSVELLVIPKGATKVGDVIRRSLLVSTGPAPPPPPVDNFLKTLKAAYAAETGADKATQVSQLAALYKQSGPIVQDTAAKTSADVLTNMHKAANNLMPTTALPKVRRAIADELDKTFATPITLTADTRSTISAQFLRVQKALEACTNE